MMRGGECWELATLERPTKGSESGFWPTPITAYDGRSAEAWEEAKAKADTKRKAGQYKKGCGTPSMMDLQRAVKMWPTPRSQDSKHGSCTDYELSRERGKDLLHVAVERARMWPTPQASDNRDRDNTGSGAIQRRLEKGKQIMLSRSVSDTSGALNPQWVEWLMAWPIGWTDLKPLETARFQAWLRSHGISSDKL
jgi:hypothetical protein